MPLDGERRRRRLDTEAEGVAAPGRGGGGAAPFLLPSRVTTLREEAMPVSFSVS